MQNIPNNISFRRAVSKDADDIFRIVCSAFNIQENTSRWHHIRSLSKGSPESFLLMERNGEAIGTLVVYSHRLRVGTTIIRKGDVGEVSILRELHGQGYGTLLMKECIRQLYQDGYHVSRLGGLNSFYAKVGYVPFPRRFYEFLLRDVKAGASMIPAESVVAMTIEQEKHIRLYHPHKDWQRRNELYDSFNLNRSGSMVEGRGGIAPSGEPDPKALRFVYEEDDNVFGYIFAEEYPNEPSPFEAKVTIYDVAFDLNKPQAFKMLMRYILRESLHRGAQRVTARLPFDPIIQQLLTDSALPFSSHEIQSALASNMMLLVNLKELLITIAPELKARCKDLLPFSPFSVLFQVNDQKATIKISNSAINIVDNEKASTQVLCDMTAFLRWLFGLNGFNDWQVNVKHNLNIEQKQVFSAMFRLEPCASGNWG